MPAATTAIGRSGQIRIPERFRGMMGIGDRIALIGDGDGVRLAAAPAGDLEPGGEAALRASQSSAGRGRYRARST